jgi:hypothetical protein
MKSSALSDSSGDVLSSMRSNGFFEWQHRERFGPSMVPGPASERLRRLFPNTPQKFHEQLTFVADKLGQKDVRELERIATALLVSQEENTTVMEKGDKDARTETSCPHSRCNRGG